MRKLEPVRQSLTAAAATPPSPLRGARSARYQSGDESPHSKGFAPRHFPRLCRPQCGEAQPHRGRRTPSPLRLRRWFIVRLTWTTCHLVLLRPAASIPFRNHPASPVCHRSRRVSDRPSGLEMRFVFQTRLVASAKLYHTRKRGRNPAPPCRATVDR